MPTRNRAIWVPVNLGIVMGVQVNVPRSHDLPGGIQDFGAVARIEPADFGDFAVFNANIGLIARDASAVDNHSVFNNCVEFSHYSHLLRSALAANGAGRRLPR